MKEREDMSDVVNALAAWFESQDIAPMEAVPIMATAICVAVVSVSEQHKHKLSTTVEGIEIASKLVLEIFHDKFLADPS